jgi:hypothetical protein
VNHSAVKQDVGLNDLSGCVSRHDKYTGVVHHKGERRAGEGSKLIVVVAVIIIVVIVINSIGDIVREGNCAVDNVVLEDGSDLLIR